MRVAIIGRSQLLYRTAELLLEKGNYEIPLVITAKEAPEYSRTAADFEKLAKKAGAEYIYTPKINLEQYGDRIKSLGNIDVAVSINYTGIIPQQVIDLFPLGILNAHSGDLPKYRGNAPLAWAILNKETRAGLCIHKMIGGELDSGNILAKEYHEIRIDTRVGELFEWIEERIPHLMQDAINKLAEDPGYTGEIQSKDPRQALRGYPRLPEDARIDWKERNTDILRLINASSEPFSGAYCEFDNKKLVIWRARIPEIEEVYAAIPGQVIPGMETIQVVCGKGRIEITEIGYEGERTSEPAGILRSVRYRLK